MINQFEKNSIATIDAPVFGYDAPVFGYIERTVTLLKGLRGHYETLYGVVITDNALKASVSLVARDLSGRQLSDKSVKLLVEACILVKREVISKPQVIENLELKIDRLNKNLDVLSRQDQDQSVLDFLLTCVDNLTLQLVAAECMWHQELTLIEQIIACRKVILPGCEIQHQIKALREELIELQQGSPMLHYEVTSSHVSKVM